MNCSTRPIRFGIAAFAVAGTAITIGTASGARGRFLLAPRVAIPVVAADARPDASAPSATGEWSEIPLDAHGRSHVVAPTDGYADCGTRRVSPFAPSHEDSDVPAPWKRSPRPDAYVDVGAWPRSCP